MKPTGRRVKSIVSESYDAFILPRRATVTAGGDALARAFLEVTLGRQNVTIGELADRCGWNQHAFVKEFQSYFPCLALRWRVERCLGFVSIWSSGAETDLRQRGLKVYGIDPRTASLAELKELCRRLGVQRPNVRRQAEWASSLFGWLAANPNCRESPV